MRPSGAILIHALRIASPSLAFSAAGAVRWSRSRYSRHSPTAMAPPTTPAVMRKRRRHLLRGLLGVGSALGMSARLPLDRCRDRERPDRLLDATVRPAAADVGDGPGDRLVARVGVGVEQGDHRQDHPRLAVAALRNLVVDPGLLHRMQSAVIREPLDSDYLLAFA